MKTKQRENSFRHTVRKICRRQWGSHDSMLVLNMSIFTFTGGRTGTFSKYEDAWFYA
jgi:hypothetical protein